MSLLTITVVIILNLLAHLFLVRFFRWYDEKSKLNRSWVSYILMIPPVSLVIAIFLIGLGLILQLFNRGKNGKKNS